MDYRSNSPRKAVMNGIDVLQPLQDNVTPEDLDAYLNAQEVYKEYLPSLQAFYEQGGEYLFRREWIDTYSE